MPMDPYDEGGAFPSEIAATRANGVNVVIDGRLQMMIRHQLTPANLITDLPRIKLCLALG
jgi:hypothetical protein